MDGKKYYLGSLYPTVYFTSQQARCMYYAIEGLNIEEIAKAMHLSPRTVGWYFELMRHKIKATHKKWLVEKIRQTNFIQHMDELSALEQNLNDKANEDLYSTL